jgi:ABC-type phosphate transport system permease subunit
VALLGFLVILYLDNTRKYALDPPFVGFFIVLFGMGCEFLWEVWEFLVDTFIGGSLAGRMQANNTDTMTDMIFVLVASLIVGAGCYVYLKRYGKEAIFLDVVRDSPYFQP